MRMSEIMNAMKQVPEKDLMDKQKIQEHRQASKRLPGDPNSMNNHRHAYNKMMGVNEQAQQGTTKQVLKEDKMKAAGALEVAKELLSESSPKNAMETMAKLKEILKDF